MANKEIKIEFSEAKLEALEFFMKENHEDVEQALKEHLDKLYTKNVPQPVKKFIESKMGSVETAEAAPEEVDETPQRQPRPYRRRNGRGTETSEEVNGPEETVAEEVGQEGPEPSDGMTMGM